MILKDDPRASFTGGEGRKKGKEKQKKGRAAQGGGWITGRWERERRKILKLRNGTT